MADVLYSVDVSVFYFLNDTLGNPFFDVFMPFLTDLNKTLYGRITAVILWLTLFLKGGKKGRIAVILLVPLIAVSDQFSSSMIKTIVMRPRPCHVLGDAPIVAGIRLLVDCGSGFSFPSSHAVNNFAAATLLSYFYRKWTWALATFAGVVALSRVFVGVHYPSDIVGGALIGMICAVFILWCWTLLIRRFPRLGTSEGESAEKT